MAASLGAAHTLSTARIRFNLPSDEFPRAMLEFYRQSHVLVIFSSMQDLRSVHTRPVVGELAPAEALTRMLEGTPLTFSVDSDHSVIIRRVTPGPEPDAVPAPPAPGVGGSSEPEPPLAVAPGPLTALKVEEVTVTGTLIHGVEGGPPLVTVTPHDMELAAYPTIQDAFYQLPINSPNAPRQDLGTSFNYNWGTGLNLRGLGVGATLVLVDGQRQALSGYDGDFVDVSNIPAAIVERVEILPDGASALYGSDAIAGVVNIVLRKDFEGTQTSLQAGTAPEGRREVTVSQIGGLHWAGGRLVLAYQYMDATALMAGERAYAGNADKTPLGGGDYLSFYNSPGNVLNPATGLPQGTPELQNPFAQYELFPDVRQHNVYASATQDVTDGVQLSAAARFTQRSSLWQQLPYQQVLAVPSSNPYYSGAAGGASPLLVAYSFLSDLGPERTGGLTDSYNTTLAANIDLWSGWHATVSGSLGRESLLAVTYDQPDQPALTAELASPDPATAFNPFGPSPAATLAAIDRAFAGRARSGLTAGSVIADGPVAAGPAGPVRLAVGAERREETLQHDVPDPDDPQETTVPQRYSRGIDAAFAELSVPLLQGAGGAQSAPELQLQLAGRYESYSDFGHTFNPSTRLAWLPSPWLRLRASWGRSFRAPTLADLHDTSDNGAGFTVLRDPSSPAGQSLVLVLQGDNPNLKEETARTWTAGFDLTPSFLSGTRIAATYYNIHYDNQIAVPAAADPFNILVDSNLWGAVITRNPTAQQVAAVCAAPALFLGTQAACVSSLPAAIVDLRVANLASTLASGLDLQAHQLFDTGLGHFDAGLTGAYFFQFEQALSSTSAAQSVLNTVGNPEALRLRATLDWNRHGPEAPGPGVTLAYSYVGGYRDPGSTLVPEVAPFGSLDLQVSYGWPQLTLRLNVVNVLNQSPPFVDNQYGYDRFNMQPLGRVVGVAVTKSW